MTIQNSAPEGTVNELEQRKKKLAELKAAGVDVFPASFDKTHNASDITAMKDGKTGIRLAGRIITKRQMGKISFCHILDDSGRVQLVFKEDTLGDNFKQYHEQFDNADFIGVEGEVFTTKKGEKSLLVTEFVFLGKALRPLPEKWHGLKDREKLYRQRYLDLISNKETKERFVLRSRLIQSLREFYWQEGFLEVETPTLLHSATGAAARPYHTHNNALDIDVVLRIAHELPLKELIVGGFEKIFEIGKAFRNEGHDPSHLPEHTHVEHYCAYWDYEKNITFTERMFDYLFETLNIPKMLKVKDKEGVEREVDFTTPWKRIDYVEMVNGDTGLDILSYTDVNNLRADLKKKKISIEGADEMSLATLTDVVYKKVSRPKLVNPTILYGYPKFLQPLARVNDDDPRLVDQFQLVVNGWEIVKAYSELVDPIDQRERFKEQLAAKELGDDEAMDVDENYLIAMEHGMPPISGWGLGIDRLAALLTEQENLRDVVLFPLMRPE